MAGQILTRIDQMWEQGLPAEVERLVDTYGWVKPLRRAIGYREFMRDDGHGIGSHDKARQTIIANTIAYAWDQSIAFNKYGNEILWLTDAEAVAGAIISYTRHYRETGEQPAAWTKGMRASGMYGPM
jgi:tRNA A37 N6-isopentenylltransferase MiaA